MLKVLREMSWILAAMTYLDCFGLPCVLSQLYDEQAADMQRGGGVRSAKCGTRPRPRPPRQGNQGARVQGPQRHPRDRRHLLRLLIATNPDIAFREKQIHCALSSFFEP
jgi:hypothetical protein